MANNWTLSKSIQCWIRVTDRNVSTGEPTSFEYSANCVDNTRDSQIYQVSKGELGFTKCLKAYKAAQETEPAAITPEPIPTFKPGTVEAEQSLIDAIFNDDSGTIDPIIALALLIPVSYFVRAIRAAFGK